jgi:hypothetical protein
LPPAAAAEREKESAAELEIGAAGEFSLPGGSSGFGPSAAIEFSPVKDLEIEIGVSPLFAGTRSEWGTELVFKKPIVAVGNMELMLGVGPEWQHRAGGAATADSAAGVAALDFQYWQLPERKLGWFVEPSYGYSFGADHEQSLGVTVGLLIAIP